MNLFCLLWMPFFYLFWRSVSGNTEGSGGIWALFIGSVVALAQFFVGFLVVPGAFGLSRWMSACIDVVTLPALAPFVVYFLLTKSGIVSGTPDYANFAMLWLIPGAAVRALSWGAQNDPILLVLVPLLWTAIAAGVSFFINLILNSRRWVIAPASLGILVIPFASASSYWAFYSQKTSYGFLFLLAAAAPFLVSMTLAFFRGDRA